MKITMRRRTYVENEPIPAGKTIEVKNAIGHMLIGQGAAMLPVKKTKKPTKAEAAAQAKAEKEAKAKAKAEAASDESGE